MAKRQSAIDARADQMLYIGNCIAALVFGFLGGVLALVLAQDVKVDEIFVVWIYTSGCAIAFVGALLVFAHAYQWALLICAGAALSAVGGYALEGAFRAEDGAVAALFLIGLPTAIAIFVGAGFVKAARRRVPNRVPRAKISSD